MTDSIELITVEDRAVYWKVFAVRLASYVTEMAAIEDRNGRMMAALEECEEYFEDWGDDASDKQMRLLQTVREAMRAGVR